MSEGHANPNPYATSYSAPLSVTGDLFVRGERQRATIPHFDFAALPTARRRAAISLQPHVQRQSSIRKPGMYRVPFALRCQTAGLRKRSAISWKVASAMPETAERSYVPMRRVVAGLAGFQLRLRV